MIFNRLSHCLFGKERIPTMTYCTWRRAHRGRHTAHKCYHYYCILLYIYAQIHFEHNAIEIICIFSLCCCWEPSPIEFEIESSIYSATRDCRCYTYLSMVMFYICRSILWDFLCLEVLLWRSYNLPTYMYIQMWKVWVNWTVNFAR